MSLQARIKRLERAPRPYVVTTAMGEDVAAFTEKAGARALRPYQAEVARAVVERIEGRLGDELTVMMARQMGKNQTSAALEHFLLHRYREAGGNIVKCAPTFKPQIVNSKARLEGELASPYSRGRWKPWYGYGLQMGRARVIFFSAAEASNVVGATADVLLEVDEAQDVDEEKYLRDFRPMASTTNATTVLYGTAWSEDCLLEKQRERNKERQQSLGRRLHFEYPWERLAEHNPLYRAFVLGEIARLGEYHPVIRTQYKLEAVAALGKFFNGEQRRLLQGWHSRQLLPQEGESYVAGVDVAGEDEEAADAALRALVPRKDSTVVTIGRVRRGEGEGGAGTGEPGLEVVEHYRWTGRDHRSQLGDLVRLLREVWACRRVVVDATGVGLGLASFLVGALSEEVVEPFVFSQPSKSRLGFNLLGMVNTGRCRLYEQDGSEDYREFWREVERATYEMRANEVMRWHVPESEGHDDYLMSLALCAWAGAGAPGPAEATIIPPRPVAYDDEGPWRGGRPRVGA